MSSAPRPFDGYGYPAVPVERTRLGVDLEYDGRQPAGAHFMFGGYLQGVQVVGEPFNGKLSEGLRNRVVYQALFGDPKLWLSEGEGHLPGLIPRSCLNSKTTRGSGSTFPDCSILQGSMGSPVSPAFQEASPQPLACPAPPTASCMDPAALYACSS